MPIWFILLISLVQTPLFAQRYKFREFRQEDGLANLATTALLQDRDHYLWVGTQNGLFRYDGAQFRRYGTSEGLPGSYVIGIVQAPDGTIWVNTHFGIARLQHDRFLAEHTYSKSVDASGMGMAVNSRGDIFVSAPGGILVGRKTGKSFTYLFSLVFFAPSLGVNNIVQIGIDDRQRAWFGCGLGLCILTSDGQLEFHQADWQIPMGPWDGILIEEDGVVWLRSKTGLLRMAKGNKYFSATTPTPSVSDLALVFRGSHGRIYLPSRDGLWIYQPKAQRWRKVGLANGLPSEPITTILEDHEDNLWIGFLGVGLMRWIGHEDWESWTVGEGLNSNNVWSLLRDSRRTLWAATENGINYFDGIAGCWRSLGGEAGKSMGRITSLSAEGQNIMWAASNSLGLVRVDLAAKTYKVMGVPKEYKGWQLFDVFVDREGRLWLGTSRGLHKSSTTDPLRWEPEQAIKNEESEAIHTITQDSRGRIWAAGNAGLVVLDRGDWRRFQVQSGLLTNSTWFARETQPDVIAIGYMESVGETRIHWKDGEPRFSHQSKQNGPTGYLSYFHGRDKAGLEWTGTDQGVFVSSASQTLHLTDQDGLIWNDCNSNAFFADDDGSVWIGTTRGLAHGRLQGPLNKVAPALRIASLKVNGREVDAQGLVKIPKAPNSLELTVSPLSFRYGNRIQYQFRLGDGEDAWRLRDVGRFHISGVPEGASGLQARVKLGPQPWSETLLDIPIEVEVPFAESWPGRLMLGLLLVSGVALVWRYRNKKLIEDRAGLAVAVANRTSEIERLLEEARESSRLKTEFLANMSHEIRTPMNGVLGMLQLTAGTPLNPEQRNFVDLAKRSAESLLTLLNEILDLSKVESGFLELDEHPFALNDCIDQVCFLLEPNARGKGIELERHLDDSLPSQVLGDGNRLKQVLMNLIGNAIKFTDTGFVKLKVSRSNEQVLHFSVEDSGIGIAKDKQELIFGAFRQADGSTTRKFGGTGLGLAISQKLVALMGGTIRVESEIGRGSCFSFSLPLKLPNGEAAPLLDDAPAEVQSSPPIRILLVEDNRVNQLVGMKLLQRQGHSVILAEDGALAVEATLHQSFDMILMDIHMPILDGIRATERIRELESGNGRRTPIVALSAGVLAEERQRCFAAGMDGFLGKPLRDIELREMLARFATAHRE